MIPTQSPKTDGSSAPLPPWLSSTVVLWACALLALLLLVRAVGFVWWERKTVIENELARAEMLARALDDQASRAVGTAGILMDAFDDELSTYTTEQNGASLDTTLRDAIAGMPFIRSFSLVDADGRVLASSSAANRGKRLDPTHLPDYGVAHAPKGMVIGHPVRGRDLGDSALAQDEQGTPSALPLTFVPLARPLQLASGATSHMIIALNTDYLANSYELMLAEPGRSAALLSYDGTVLATTAGIPLAGGTSLSRHPIFGAMPTQRDHGSFVGTGLDSTEVISAYRAARNWPLVTVVETSYRVALAPWRRMLSWVVPATVAGLLLILAIGTAAWRGLRSYEQVRGALDRLNRDVAANAARKSAILTAAMDGMITLDEHGSILEFNQEAERIFGRRAAEVLGQPMEPLLLPPESRGQLGTGAVQPKDGQPGTQPRRRFELTALRAGGECFPLEMAVVPVLVNGQHYLSCTLRDISEARRAAQEREQLLARHRDAAASLRVLKRALDQHAIVSIFSPQGVFVYANRKLVSTSGYSREQLVGQSARLLRPSGAGEPVAHDLMALLLAGAPWEGQLVHQRQDGTLYWAASTVVPIHDSHGHLRQSFLIQTDVSKQIAGERATEAARRTELELGAGIQRGLLMRELPGNVLDCFLAGFNVASQGINGDFVDLFQFSDDCFDILVGDAMGKGVPAALLGAGLKMQFARSLAELHTRAAPFEPPSPAQIVAHVQHAMHRQLQELESFVTVCYLRIDRARGTLTWVGCGHEETLLLHSDGTYALLANQHPPLGVIEEDAVEQDTVPLLQGDTVALYSDGLADAIGPAGTRFGMPRLTETMQALLQTHRRPGTIARGMRRAMDAFVAGGRVVDDMTMLVLQAPSVGALHEWRLELQRAMDRLSELRRFVMERGAAGGLSDERAAALALAAVELASNAIRHCGEVVQDPLEIMLQADRQACRLELLYLGPRFTPPALLEPDFSGHSEGGFGLYIIRESCDAVDYSHADGINRVVLTKRLTA